MIPATIPASCDGVRILPARTMINVARDSIRQLLVCGQQDCFKSMIHSGFAPRQNLVNETAGFDVRKAPASANR